MPVPARSTLRAAKRWLDHLPTSDISRTRAIFSAHPQYADITPTQYSAALSWLREHDLIRAVGSPNERAAAVFTAAINDALWLPDADVLLPTPADLPDDAFRAAEALDLSPAEAAALIHDRWQKVDAEARARVGAAGELELVRIMDSAPETTVRHVSLDSDGYGFDVLVRWRSTTLHLEVKSTVRRGRLRFYISRHEFDTMRRDLHWRLVALRLDDDLKAASLASVRTDWLESVAPRDTSTSGRWESFRVDVPPDAIIDGVPEIASAFGRDLPPIVAGIPPWPG